jgi:formate-dependent nitrite reductase membrane component NrfD
MDTDLFLVIGLVVLALSVPSLLSAYVEGRIPRAGSILILIGGVLVVTALSQKGQGYTFAELPDVVFRVIGRYID